MDFSFLNNMSSGNKDKWNFSAIYDNNILGVKDKFPNKNEFLLLKADKNSAKGKARNFLRKKTDLFFESFLSNNTDKDLKLQTALQIKAIVNTFAPAKINDYKQVFEFLAKNENNGKTASK